MPRKVVILVLAAAAAVPAGCGTTRPAAPASAEVKIVLAPQPAPQRDERPAARPTRRPTPDPTPAPTPAAPRSPAAPREDLAALIKGDARWSDAARSTLVVTDPGRPATGDPVPLFKQAIVIASVRSAVAGSPATPEAAFRNGQLTLSFRGGSPAEVASAVNRALAVPEVNRLVVVPPSD